MKTALMALALVLGSSSAFATSPEPTCDQVISMNSQRLVSDATAFIDDIESMANMQIQQDGESQMAYGTRGMMARARTIIDVVSTIQKNGKSSDVYEKQVAANLCAANLDVMTVISSSN
ncbi:hypothetical protein EON76_06880 [bacterium]|nr:MAG: hypothetical protein EON76_06880 [bacterium]